MTGELTRQDLGESYAQVQNEICMRYQRVTLIALFEELAKTFRAHIGHNVLRD